MKDISAYLAFHLGQTKNMSSSTLLEEIPKNTGCFILNGTKRIAQCDCRIGFIQPKLICSATTIIQVLFGNREKSLNDELAARGSVKQNAVHAGENVLHILICQNLLGNCCAKTFLHEIL